MTLPQPLLKAQNAFQQLIALTEKGITPDELSLARFQRAAKESMHLEPSLSYQLLGIIAAFKWNIADIHKNFRLALDQGAGTTGHSNYAQALAEVNEITAAAEQSRLATSKQPENLTCLRAAIVYSFRAGQWAPAKALLDQLAVRASDDGNTGMKQLKAALHMADHLHLNEETVQKSMECVFQFLQEKRIKPVLIYPILVTLPAEESIYIRIEIQTTYEEAITLDEEFTVKWFDAVADTQLGVFVIALESYSH